MTETDIPVSQAEVAADLAEYERALVTNDVAVLWPSEGWRIVVAHVSFPP